MSTIVIPALSSFQRHDPFAVQELLGIQALRSCAPIDPRFSIVTLDYET